MGFDKKRTVVKKVTELYSQGFTQKEIAKQTNTTERTIGLWIKDLKKKDTDNKASIKKLESKLSEMLENPNTPALDIHNITLSIRMLDNRILKKL